MKFTPHQVLVAVAFALASGFTLGVGHSSANSGRRQGSWRLKVSPDLLQQLDRNGPDTEYKVIIKTSGKLSAYHKDVLRAIGSAINQGRSLDLIDGVSAQVSLSQIKELAKRGDFAYISADRPVKMLGHLETTTGAAQIRNLLPGSSGLNGAGIGIAVLDSGIDESHHELNYNWNDRVVADVDGGGFGNTFDYMGHGTFVSSIAAGTNHIGPGIYTGIAPGANIINVKVLDSNGAGYESQIISAINWCVTHRSTYNIRVINLSLGAPAVDSYRNDPLCQAVRAAHDAGIVVVVAAGNDGKDANGNKLYGAIESPAIEPSAITVGASNTFGTDSRADDGVTTYSSRGPTRGHYQDPVTGRNVYDNLIKPDLVAPGNKMISAEARGADIVKQYPQLDASQYESNPHHYVMYMSGTSVSAPVVSGAVALLLQENPALTPNEVKAILMYTAQPLKGFNTFEQGAGELNIDGAVRVAKLVRNLGVWARNGQPMLNDSLPPKQSSIAGFTFQWGQGVITNWTFLYGDQLMTNWQGMYGQGTLLTDGTLLSSYAVIRNPFTTSSGVELGTGILLSDGTILSSGVLVSDSYTLANGILLSDGMAIADGVLLSDGILLSDGTLVSDACLGDPGGMTPQPDGNTY